MKRVALVSMPFGTTTRPAIGISLLKAELERESVPCDLHYLNLAFANRIGIERYERICNVNDTLLAEYVFAKGLFGERIPTPEAYASEILAPSSASAATRGMALAERVEVLSSWVQLLVEHANQFLDSCMHTVDWGEYALVGFTTTFHQTLASIALATRIKQQWPQTVTVFGGANCESEMGQALHRLFPVIDFVCSGEADYSFPRLARQVVDGAEVGELPGVLRRRNGASQLPKVNGEPIKDMDALPYPDYDDYVSQRASLLGLNDPPELLVETARGCWWGKKSHCTFCGLNGETMEFRAKSQARALAEIIDLAQRYGATKIASVDNIIAMDYFTDLLPELAARKIGLELFYETKANLRRSQVKLLRESGILRIQPGIESLNSNVLRIMKKGVSALQNIQLLRWCAEFMVDVQWNLLAGFPGETPEQYARQAELVPLLVHLAPPLDCGVLRLDRFSPLFNSAEEHGLVNVRPRKAYAHVFPFEGEELRRLAYFFDFDYADGRNPNVYIQELLESVNRWRAVHTRASLLSLSFVDRLVIWDSRSISGTREHWLTGIKRAIYEFCDEARSASALERHIASADFTPSERASLADVLSELVEMGLLLNEDGKWLSLGVAAEYQIRMLSSLAKAGLPAPPRTAEAFARLHATAPDVVRQLVALLAEGEDEPAEPTPAPRPLAQEKSSESSGLRRLQIVP